MSLVTHGLIIYFLLIFVTMKHVCQVFGLQYVERFQIHCLYQNFLSQETNLTPFGNQFHYSFESLKLLLTSVLKKVCLRFSIIKNWGRWSDIDVVILPEIHLWSWLLEDILSITQVFFA